MSAPSSIDIAALRSRISPDVEQPSAVSPIAAADTHEETGFIYWPNLLARHQLTTIDLKETRKRSQWLCINTAARVLRRLTRYVGVSAIKPDTNDIDFNAIVTKWWRETYQNKAGNYEMSGKYSSETYLTNCLYQAWRDSDVLSLHLTKPDGEPTCAAVEAARIDNPWGAINDRWQDGVLTDAFYRHLAYSVAIDPPGTGGNWLPTKYIQVPAGHCHMFADFESQASTRGTPALIHAVADLLDEREIQNALIAIVKAHAQVGYLFETEAGSSNSGTVPFVPPGAKRKETIEPGAANSTGVKGSPGTRTVAEVMSRADILTLSPGMKAKVLADGRDHPNETELKNGIYKKLALGLGLPVEVFILLDQLTGPGVRFVLRQTQDWREYWLKSMETFQSVDYARRLEWAMRTGRVPKCKDPDYARHYFVKPRAITIDDGRTASSQVAALFAGTTNLAEIFGEKGQDWKPETTQSIEELAFIEAECKRLNVTPALYFDRQRAAVGMALADLQAQAAAEQPPPDKKAA